MILMAFPLTSLALEEPAISMTPQLTIGSEYTVVVKGDLDPDGSVTASDARLILRASVGLESQDAWFDAIN